MKIPTSIFLWFLCFCHWSCKSESGENAAPITFERTIHWKTFALISAVAETDEHHYVIAGRIGSNLFLGRFSQEGDSLWIKDLEFQGNPLALFVEDNGDLVILSSRHFVKTDPQGQIILTKSWPEGLWPVIANRSASGTFLLAGDADSSSAGKSSAFFFGEFDVSGNSIWTLSIPGPHGVDNRYLNEGWCVIQLSDSCIIAGGTEYYATEPVGTTVLMEIKRDGNNSQQIVWQKEYRSARFWRPFLFKETTGNITVIGEGSDGALDILKTNATGDSLIFKEHIAIGELHDAHTIFASNNLVLLMSQQTSFGNYDVRLTKVTMEGDTLWSKVFGGPASDFCFRVVPTSDGGYFMAGKTGNDQDIYLIKVDEAGNFVD